MSATRMQDTDRQRFERELLVSFEEESVEDGMYHPAEDIILDALKKRGEKALSWIREFILDATRPDLGYSILLCLTHRPPPGTASWRVQLIHDALGSRNIVVRDAAAQAAESWADPEVVPTLRTKKANEPVGWLQDYMRGIIEDIQGKMMHTAPS